MSGYKNWQCRCDPCRKAWAEYFTAYRHRKGWVKPRSQYLEEVTRAASEKPCGTESKYSWGCRCSRCRTAAAAARQRRRRAAA